MARLPFNPDRVNPPAGSIPPVSSAGGRGTAAGRNDPPPLSVSQANRLVKDVIAQAMPGRLRIIGQVSNFSDRSHWYFSLKDAGSAMRCVCFASAARKSGVPLADGMEVVVTGRFDVYDAQGQLQFYVDKIQPVGQGALELQFRALCEELRSKGYFDDARKKPLPVMPCKVVVITSRSAAALQDVINTATRRWAGCQLYLMDVRVQGAAAAPQIAQAIRSLAVQGRQLGIDAIILTRGGGSIEDLWAFNDRAVAEAIYKCPLPIVAAIGHETDTTIAELVADVRSSTPTQAAMTLIPDQKALDHQVHQLHRRLHLLTDRLVQHARQRLTAAARHTLFRRPVNMLLPVQERLGTLQTRLQDAGGRLVSERRQRLHGAARHLAAVSPQQRVATAEQQLRGLQARLVTGTTRGLSMRQQQVESLARQLTAIGPGAVLKRGYTYTLDAQGKPVHSARVVKAGQRMVTVFADGRVGSVVEGDTGATPQQADRTAETQTPSLTPSASAARPRKKTTRGKKAAPAEGLFAQLDESNASESDDNA